MRSSFSLIRFISLFLILPGFASWTMAQESSTESMDPGGFYGFWEFQEPAGDTCVVIIKRGGRLSCFYAGTASRAIQKGSWERNEDTLTAHWESGYTEVLDMLGENAIERKTYEPGASLLGDPTLTIRGVRVDSRIPGSLTVKREGGSAAPVEEVPEDPKSAPALPMRNAFIGYWKIEQPSSLFDLSKSEPHYYMHLERSGNANVSLRDWEGDKAVRGRWTVEDEEAVITWPNNRRDVLRPKKTQGYVLETYKPRAKPGSSPQNRSTAEKVTSADAARYFDAGNFKRLTVEDIRGTWHPRESDGETEYLSIEGWGNAYRFPAADGNRGTDPGKWRLQNDRVQITWVDGSKDVIRITPDGFLQESFPEGEPVTGTPVRSIPVVLTEE